VDVAELLADLDRFDPSDAAKPFVDEDADAAIVGVDAEQPGELGQDPDHDVVQVLRPQPAAK
jgi:hypothetical protein